MARAVGIEQGDRSPNGQIVLRRVLGLGEVAHTPHFIGLTSMQMYYITLINYSKV